MPGTAPVPPADTPSHGCDHVDPLEITYSNPYPRPTPEEEGEYAWWLERDAILAEEEGAIEEDREALLREFEEVPRTLPGDRLIGTRLDVLCSATVALLCFILIVSNAARFAVAETQSWLFAFLFTGVFAGFGIGLEAVAEKLSDNRKLTDRVIAWLLPLSGLAFLIAFAWRFTYSEGVGAIDDTLGAFDFRLIFITQGLLELSTGYALIGKIKERAAFLREPVINPLWLDLRSHIESRDYALWAKKTERADLRKSIVAFEVRRARYEAFSEKLNRFLRA